MFNLLLENRETCGRFEEDKVLEPKSWDEIVSAVKENAGVVTLHAYYLRLAGGHGRLTPRINQQISDALRSRGLGHVPAEVSALPTDQEGLVRVYDATSPLGTVISAVIKPGDDQDKVIREAIDGEAKALLEEIRALLDDTN